MPYAGYLVLDFDGTIADTLEMALVVFNRIAPDYDLKPVGDGEWELFRTRKPQEMLETYGISKLKLLTLTLRIRKEMNRHVPEMKLFDNMEKALCEIRADGFRMGILTSNSVENVRKFLEINNLTDMFDFIYSGRSFLGKDKVIRKMIIREQLQAARIVYAGDETRDIEACRAAGIPVIAVSWGLSSRELLASLLPDQIADRPEELPDRLRQIRPPWPESSYPV